MDRFHVHPWLSRLALASVIALAGLVAAAAPSHAGVAPRARILAPRASESSVRNVSPSYGHGTFLVALIAGSGQASGGVDGSGVVASATLIAGPAYASTLSGATAFRSGTDSAWYLRGSGTSMAAVGVPSAAARGKNWQGASFSGRRQPTRSFGETVPGSVWHGVLGEAARCWAFHRIAAGDPAVRRDRTGER